MKTLICKGCSYPTRRCSECGADCCSHFAETVPVQRNEKRFAICVQCMGHPDDWVVSPPQEVP